MSIDSTKHPALAAWANGQPCEIFWEKVNEIVLVTMNLVIDQLTSTNPTGLPIKRKDFQAISEEDRQIDLRRELVIGYRLDIANVSFVFGGTGQPDIICSFQPDTRQLSIEVTSRNKDDLRKLMVELRSVIDPNVGATLTVPNREVSIRAEDRQAICELVKRISSASDWETTCVSRLTGIDGSITFDRLASGVQLATNFSVSQVQTEEIEREFHNVLKTKVDQYNRNGWSSPTILIIDAARLGVAWTFAENVWERILANLKIDWTTVPFVGVAVVFMGIASTAINGLWLQSPSIDGDDLEHVIDVLVALGLVTRREDKSPSRNVDEFR